MAIGVEADSISYAVVEAVAVRAGVDPMDLTSRLNDVVDSESLDRLFLGENGGRSGPGGRVEFRYCGYDVTVFSDGRVDVRG